LSSLSTLLSGFARISEFWTGQEGWVRGHLIHDPVCFELCFNAKLVRARRVLPGTEIIYLQIMMGRKEVFEFSLGRICGKKPTEAEFAQYVAPFIRRLNGYHHVLPGSRAFIDAR
jgi:hypothetical protein